MGQRKGPWTPEEDFLLTHYIQTHGEGQWRTLPKKAGLQRCGKGCRLRWMNYLRPNVKRGNISTEEEELIIRLHKLLGNRWSLIAGRVPGRTDNEIKNYCNTRLSKKLGCKASMNKTTNVSERANATGVWKTDISNAGVNIDCMSEKHIYSVAEDLTTSSVFNGADFIVYDNLQAPYSTVNYNEYMDMTGHSTVNYNEYMDMTGHVFAGKFIYNEMDALNKTLLGDSAHIHHLPSANHEEAFWAGDLTASQHMCFGNGSDSSTPLLQQQSQGIEYEPHLVSTCIFDESNDTTNSLLNCQGIIAYEETPKPNALIERQSNCFNHFLDYGKLN